MRLCSLIKHSCLLRDKLIILFSLEFSYNEVWFTDQNHQPLERRKHNELIATDTFKTASRRAIQKAAEAICDSIGNIIADKITKISSSKPKSTKYQKI